MTKQSCFLYVKVEYDDGITSPERLAIGLSQAIAEHFFIDKPWAVERYKFNPVQVMETADAEVISYFACYVCGEKNLAPMIDVVEGEHRCALSVMKQ